VVHPNSEENRKKNSVEREASMRDDFEQWWRLYPKRVGQGHARKCFEKIIKLGLATVEQLKVGAMRYALQREGQDQKFTKHPATWLNAEGWNDEPAKPAAFSTRATNGYARIARRFI
jgi:hypothetical protein